MKERGKRKVSLLVIILFVFNMLSNIGAVNVKAAELKTIAYWEKASGETFTSSKVLAIDGDLKGKAVLDNDRQISPTSTKNGVTTSGWDSGKDKKYWSIKFSAKGFENMSISAKTRSSGTGPKDFKLTYSTDGTNFKDIAGSNYEIKDTYQKLYIDNVKLPNDASNKDNVEIRIIMTSNKNVKGADVQNGGASSINNIKITGTGAAIDGQAEEVTAEPENNSKVKNGQELTLSTKTEGAVIKYSVNDSEIKDYDPDNKPKLTNLPATVVAYAVKSGLNDSKKNTFYYTQGQVEAVTATPNGGSVKAGSKVTLKCATENSKILYSTDNGSTWTEYKEPFAITSLPTTVLAKATSDGMIDSAESKFIYKLKTSDGKLTQYFGQLHSHTTNSDGAGSVEDAFKHASTVKDIDFLAVTDHSNSLETTAGTANIKDGSSSTKWLYGRDMADKYTVSDKFTGIYGYEMTWSNGTGHINTYNSAGFENRNTAKYKLSSGLKTYYDVLKTVPDTISQFNHPGTTFGDFNDFANYDPVIDNLITLVEVGNGEGAIGSNGYFPSYQYYTRALDKGWHVAPTNNQDNHKGKWGDANTARSVLLADSLDRDDLYDAMRNRRAYATEDQNLKVNYTLNGEEMGTILDSKPSDVNIKVTAEDPDGEAIGKVEVIVNGGKVVAEKNFTESKIDTDFKLPADYSYYYIRIDQKDKDIAVTAPVWTGEVEKAGISKSECSTELPVKGEELGISTSLYNNEASELKVKNIEYSIDGKVIKTGSGDEVGNVPSLGTNTYSFKYTPDKSGTTSVDVKLTAELNGVEKVYTDVLKLKVSDPKLVTKVVVDGSHYNDYVSGYYNGNMTNFTKIAAKENVQVTIADKITDDTLKDASALVISAPAKTAGNKNGVEWQPSEFSDEFISMVKKYVDNGGNLLICGIADYQDNKTDNIHQTTTQMNKLLKAIGATSKLNNDEVVDNTTNAGQPYRLKFKNFNMESPYLKDVVPEQEYSFYSGCSVLLDKEAVKSGKTQWLVNGFKTTESLDSNKKIPAEKVEQGNVCALASEKLPGGGNMIIGGTIFMSNFEVQAELDNAGSLQYVNYTVVSNFLDSVKKTLPVSKISDVRKGTMGDVFSVEGTVTAGTESGNAFFDTIYVQDSTGGINIFPINDGSIKVGQKVKVTGSLDQYQGDLELRVIDYEVTDKNINKVAPKEMSIKDAADYGANGGMLAKVQGKISKVQLENGKVSYVVIKDNDGNEMRVFIDGYINNSDKNSTALESFAKEGNEISAVGLISQDPDGIRLRVRDRSEVMLVKAAENTKPDNPQNPGENQKPGETQKPGDSEKPGTSGDNQNPGSAVKPQNGSDKNNGTVKPAGINSGNKNNSTAAGTKTDNNSQNGTLVKTGGYGSTPLVVAALIMTAAGCVILRRKNLIKGETDNKHEA